MRTLKLTIAYDGTDYSGWQAQPDRRTIQGTFEATWAKITRESLRAVASGRTDAGVHARGQVLSLQTDSRLSVDTLRQALNAELPHDVAVLAVEEAAPDFHAIGDTLRKTYRYTILDGRVRDVFARRYVWHVPHRLDERAMQVAGQALIGRHDFSSFENQGAPRTTSVRTLFDLRVSRPQTDRVEIEVTADGFLYNMVRTIVGSLVEVGRGVQPPEWIAEVLAAQDRRRAGQTAPPQGLCLLRVEYD